MKRIWIKDAVIINENREFRGSVLIQGDKIEQIYEGDLYDRMINISDEIIDASGKWLIPGVIDDQVHFREPGLTYKADIHSESMAAAAGGITSYMEMPNTVPQTTTIDALEWKFERAARTSVVNYSFYIGANNDNLAELKKINPKRICGVKVFMGSSTGNMLVNNTRTLENIFREISSVIAVHCEKEEIIKANREMYVSRFGEDLPVMFHPLIRSAEACYASSAQAVELASRNMHIWSLTSFIASFAISSLASLFSRARSWNR